MNFFNQQSRHLSTIIYFIILVRYSNFLALAIGRTLHKSVEQLSTWKTHTMDPNILTVEMNKKFNWRVKQTRGKIFEMNQKQKKNRIK